jgi:hypothetical protein
VNDDISAVIESIIARESSPISAKEIFQRVKVLNDTVDLWQIETQLKQLQEQGLLYEYPPLRKTQKCRYWHKPPVQWVKDRIKNFVGQDSPWPTIKYVRTKLHKWERNFFNAAYGDLIEGKSLFELRLYNSAYLS